MADRETVRREVVLDLIQADDLGYCDLSIHGNPVIRTPNLDKLGRESLRFTHFYVHSVCSPTRAAIMSGDPLTEDEIQSLLVESSRLEHPHNCPHGRPTVLTFTGQCP